MDLSTPNPQKLPWIFEESRSPSQNDNKFLKLAREIAMDMKAMDEILAMHDVDADEWEFIKSSAAFQAVLKRAISEWATATNTRDRVALKSLAMVEESLPEFYVRMHDPKESLAAKTEVLKAISRFAGVGVAGAEVGMAEKLTVTINLGGDSKLSVTKDVTPRGSEEVVEMNKSLSSGLWEEA